LVAPAALLDEVASWETATLRGVRRCAPRRAL